MFGLIVFALLAQIILSCLLVRELTKNREKINKLELEQKKLKIALVRLETRWLKRISSLLEYDILQFRNINQLWKEVGEL